MATSSPRKPKLTVHYTSGTAQFYTETAISLTPEQIPLDMVYVPPGEFLMGSPAEELGHRDSESPQHRVALSEPFFMGKSPITQAQWRAVAQLPQLETELRPNPARFKWDNRPVEQINWYESVEFCRRLEAATGRPYRLPTEAEWEYACRAGTVTPFHFGPSITTDLANYRGTDRKLSTGKNRSGAYGDGPHGQFRKQTTDVGSFDLTNAFGLSDMHGNVWEWCQDTWHNSYSDAPKDGRAWEDSEDSRRVLRGGSWNFNPEDCRSAFRLRVDPVSRYDFIGLRVVCGIART